MQGQGQTLCLLTLFLVQSTVQTVWTACFPTHGAPLLVVAPSGVLSLFLLEKKDTIPQVLLLVVDFCVVDEHQCFT